MTFDERLLALIHRLGERVVRSHDVVELVRHHERGVALEMLVANLDEDSVHVTEQERADCIELVEELGLGPSLSAMVRALPTLR